VGDWDTWLTLGSARSEWNWWYRDLATEGAWGGLPSHWNAGWVGRTPEDWLPWGNAHGREVKCPRAALPPRPSSSMAAVWGWWLCVLFALSWRCAAQCILAYEVSSFQ